MSKPKNIESIADRIAKKMADARRTTTANDERAETPLEMREDRNAELLWIADELTDQLRRKIETDEDDQAIIAYVHALGRELLKLGAAP